MGRILVVEDEQGIAELVSLNLRHQGHEVHIAASSERATELLREALPDLVILDWMLPGESGLTLAREWRRNPRTKDLPIIMLTARTDGLVEGLDAGADDYLGKPFSIMELLARVRALMRRRVPEALDHTVEAGALRLEPTTHRVYHGSTRLTLGPTEFRLLKFLLTHPERVHTRSQLLDRVWGDHVFIEERTVDVHIKRLRDALSVARCADMIETVRGVGYRLVKPVHSAA